MRVPAMALALLATVLFNAGCATVDTSACPKIKNYTKAESTKAANELLELCPSAAGVREIHLKCPGRILPRYMDDYHAEREQLRSCN